MWLPKRVYADVENVARVFYVNKATTDRWNKYRQPGELAMRCGWAWTAKNGREARHGLMSATVAYTDAYYTLVSNEPMPDYLRPRVRVIQGGRKRAAA